MYLDGAPMSECAQNRDFIITGLYNQSQQRFLRHADPDDLDASLSKALKRIIHGYSESEAVFNDPAENMTDTDNESFEKAKLWLTECGLLKKVWLTNDINKISAPMKQKIFFSDLAMLRHCINLHGDARYLSNLRGYLTENFVVLALYSMPETFRGKYVWRYDNVDAKPATPESVDFFLTTPNFKKVLLEAKTTRGAAKSSDAVLKANKADYLIKFQDHIGTVHDKVIELPLYAIDKLPIVIDLIDSGKIDIIRSIFTKSLKKFNIFFN
jgi:hypothetical protein